MPASEPNKKFRGAFWSAVAGDLTSLQNYVDNDVRNVSAALTPLISRNVVSKWNDLKEAGER